MAIIEGGHIVPPRTQATSRSPAPLGLSNSFFRGYMNGDDDDYNSSPSRDRSNDSGVEFSDYSPERNPRSHLTSAKSIDVIREDDEDVDDDENYDVPLNIGK